MNNHLIRHCVSVYMCILCVCTSLRFFFFPICFTNSLKLLLKRPREDMPSKTASGGKHSTQRSVKRSGHSGALVADLSQASSANTRHNSPTKNITGTALSNNNENNNNAQHSTPPSKNNIKIIVNQFHASSLLNSQHFEEKEQILTQNGLTNPQAATAYEASFYAANYLTPEARNNQMHGMIRSNLAEYSNYVGVFLANNGPNGNGHTDDDPCAGEFTHTK